MQHTGCSTDLHGFTSSLGSITVDIVTAAVAYDCLLTHRTYILCFPQSLYVPDLNDNLLCVFQLRCNGITVNDVPLQFIPADKRSPTDHSIITDSLIIPLHVDKVNSCFNTRVPTDFEISNPDVYERIYMTNDAEWRPNDRDYADVESRIRNSMHLPEPPRDTRTINTLVSGLLNGFFPLVQISETDVDRDGVLSAIQTKKRKGHVSAVDLAKRWRIGLQAAERTLEHTTQLAVRDFTHVTGGRRLKPTAYQLKNRRLNTEMYTDTVYFATKSIRQFTCAQLFCTDFQWSYFVPLKTTSDAHLSLDRLFHNVGIPRIMIPDNHPSLTAGDF